MTIKLDQSDGVLTLHTRREGAAGRIGHDLTIRVNEWSVSFSRDGDQVSRLIFSAALFSLEVIEGAGGLKPLSAKDKSTIVANAQKTLRMKEFPSITFKAEGTQTAVSEGTTELVGDLSIAGATRPVTVVVDAHDGLALTAEVEVRQTDFGVKPYSAMLGQLRVADVVTVRFDARIPA